MSHAYLGVNGVMVQLVLFKVCIYKMCRLRVKASLEALRCALEQGLYPLLSIGSTQEDPSHD